MHSVWTVEKTYKRGRGAQTVTNKLFKSFMLSFAYCLPYLILFNLIYLLYMWISLVILEMIVEIIIWECLVLFYDQVCFGQKKNASLFSSSVNNTITGIKHNLLTCFPEI